MFLGIVVFLFLLAIFDLVVGVSNDAVNFMNSAIGAKAASFKTIIAIAAFGIFIGATLSNGMMEIARHGIFRPEQFYFQELMCIFLAVMVTDVVLLDIFNSLGMPTSTTVSMVFELLGGTFVLALIKIAGDETGMLGFADLLNTEKALSVILGIFLSVAVAFFFGTLVQYLSRLLFTFNYTKKLKYTIGLFGGIAVTAIIYFMLIKGLKDSAFMTTENKHWIQENTLMLVSCSFVFFTILMQILHWCKINVFKVVVMLGTFALAMASSSQSRLAAAVALSANASSRPSFVSKSISLRFTATSSFPVVSIIITSSMPALAKPSVVLFPAIILLFLSSRIERPAPNVRRLFSIMLCPNCVPLLKFKSSGIRSSIFVFLIFAISNRF